MEITPELKQKIELLQQKYAAMGQDLSSYLDGLLYADYLTYWDYVQVDTLLTLQQPKTNFPDEKIFIVYHQITELYFNLCLHEFQQICTKNEQSIGFTTQRLARINRYFEALTHSFEIMVDGMEKGQFLQFRMSLLPASGFQSAQYRLIEMYSTQCINLVAKDKRQALQNATTQEMYEEIYWKYGATELATGKKTLTLLQFEEKYKQLFLDTLSQVKGKTIYDLSHKYNSQNTTETNALFVELKKLDTNVNVNWPLSHYKSAVRYLHKSPEDIAATGGTNWQKYLPPRFQKRIFFEFVWSKEEIENWGKQWVNLNVFQIA
jgi:tryptophan 2,3-dioxygenase